MKYVLLSAVFLTACSIFNQPVQPPVQEDSTPVSQGNIVNENSNISVKKSLDLSNQHLTSVPSNTFNKTSIEELNLSGNQLTGAIPAEVRLLTNLKILNLRGNSLTGVPAEVGQLSQLVILDLSNNQLTGLPHELANLKNLQLLDLRGNNPSEFDVGVIRQGIPQAEILL